MTFGIVYLVLGLGVAICWRRGLLENTDEGKSFQSINKKKQEEYEEDGDEYEYEEEEEYEYEEEEEETPDAHKEAVIQQAMDNMNKHKARVGASDGIKDLEDLF